ncbi:MAG: ferritin family protein [Desulfobacterales bacterium]
MFTSVDILDVAVQLEKNGEKIFRTAVEKVKYRDLAELLEWMADQEKEHIQWFTDLKQKIKEPFNDPVIQEMGKEILQDTLKGASFDLNNVDFSRIDEVKELLTISIEFEKDTAVFYELLLSFVEDPETKELIEKIIDEEHNHVRLLKEFVETSQMA